jgi:formate dehydrogenase iron-sulfur subunit
MAENAVLVDVSRCIGCRGCQVACKQWNKNSAEPTYFLGTYENPPSLSYCTFTRVRFRETVVSGKLAWLFMKEQCRHCVDPACKGGCPIEGAITKTEEGAVVVTDKCVGGQGCEFECKEMCPRDIPRFLPDMPKRMKKCTLCVDRQRAGKKPACVTACLSGALLFGARAQITAEAQNRLVKMKREYSDASILDKDDAHIIYLLPYKSELYGCFYQPKNVLVGKA